MSKYLLIESRDSFESRDSEKFLDLVGRIAANGDQVILFLIQNAVLILRKGSMFSSKLRELMHGKVEVHVDEFSLRERSIQEWERPDFIVVSNMDQLIEILMEPGTKTIWHS